MNSIFPFMSVHSFRTEMITYYKQKESGMTENFKASPAKWPDILVSAYISYTIGCN